MSNDPEPQKDKLEEFRERFGRKHTVRKDPATMERRRKNVWEMYLEGVPQTQMAKILNVTRQTVSSDIDYLEKKQQTYTTALKDDSNAAALDIGVTIKKLESIADEAWSQARLAETALEKNSFFNTAIKAMATRNRILIETGYLPKAGLEIKTTVENKISFEKRFGTDSKYKIMDDAGARRRILAVAEAALRLGLKDALNDNTIDAEAKVVDSSPPTTAPGEQPPAH